MNLWALVSSIVLSLGLSSSQFYYLPLTNFVDNNNLLQANIQQLVSVTKLPQKIDNKSWGVKITAPSAAVMDKDSGTILWQKSADEVRPIASITKLMTALVFLDHNPGWQTPITLTKEDETNGATVKILRGETVTVKDLFYSSLIASANNATNALVRSTTLSKQEFVELMNAKARDLGLAKTSFVGITGLSADNKSTAIDILHLAKIAFDNKDIKASVDKQAYNFTAISGQTHKIVSTNNLLNSYLDISAGKTGFIDQSGYCLVVEVQGEDNQSILTVVLGSASNALRFQDAKILSAWTLGAYSWY